MDPRTAVATGILSGMAAVLGMLLVFYCGVVKNRYEPRDYTEFIDEDDGATDLPPSLKLVGSPAMTPALTGRPCGVEFRLHNLTAVPVAIPGTPYFSPRYRTWKGDLPSCLVEILDEEGTRQPYVRRWTMCGNRDPLTAEAFATIPPGGSLALVHSMLSWVPTRPGTYRVRMALDTRWNSPRDWGDFQSQPERNAIPLLRRLPQGVFVSEPVTVVVRP
jgi:hypothetical protein